LTRVPAALTRTASVLAAFALGTGVAVAAIIAGTSSSPPPIVHVVHPHSGPARLVDAQGRALLLRGVAVTGLIDYAPDYEENPPVTAADNGEIAALGFDFVRLPVSWSLIEPSPGHYDASYLGLIAQTVQWARAKGLYVLIDMHNDRYNKALAPHNEADGAPGWATLTPLIPCVVSATPVACERDAWQSFWTNRAVAGKGLQQHYIGALAAVSQAVRGDRAIAGIELMNNPSTGYTPSPQFDRTQLWPFYRKAIRALRDAGEQRPLWIDRSASSEQSDADPAGVPAPFSDDRQLVYAPHDYAGVFSSATWPGSGPQLPAQWYAAARADAAALGMPIEVGEWGNAAGGAWEQLVPAKLDLQDAGVAGSSFWMWKQRPGFYDWPVVQLNGALRTDSMRAQQLSRPHPDAVPGTIDSISFDGTRLSVGVHGPGGRAVFWSGTEVLAGGQSALARPLTHVFVDRRAAVTTQRRVGYASAGVSLVGYLVSVPFRSGRHTVVLR
jgi:endoglycosylceramidase